ncbi:hypothetical protein [Georgenia halophila]|uniref:hypothetical protein n=1 Tax=Georgenia halophila TaxID=620889 RepID=UPI0031EF0C9D
MDHDALVGARADLDRMIAEEIGGRPIQRRGIQPPPSRRKHRALLPAGAAAAIAAGLVVASVMHEDGSVSGERDFGEIVAAGPDGFVVPAASADASCTERSGDVPVREAVAGGVGYLLGGDLRPVFVTPRVDEVCAEAAPIAASFVRTDEDQSLSAAITVWGPDAVSPIPWLDGPASTTAVDLGGVPATITTYEAGAGVIFEDVSVLSWSGEAGDWVITASNMAAAQVEAAARAVAAQNAVATLPEVLPDFVDMTDPPADSSTGHSWIAAYGDFSFQDPGCPAGCGPDRPAEMPDHMTLTVDETRRLPWAARASTRTLHNPYTDRTATYRVIDVDGTPGLFSTAGERGLEGEVRWQIAPGTTAVLRGTWGGAIEGIIPFASDVEAVTAEDPRIPARHAGD